MNTTNTSTSHHLSRSASTSSRTGLVCGLICAVLSACSLLGSKDDGLEDATFDDSYEGTDTSNDTDTPPPTEGFRVSPKFMLQPVPAIVTIEEGDGSGAPIACVLDGAPEGGYICDSAELIGPFAQLRVDKDGFDSAQRVAEILTNQIQPLDIHLSAEGGPTGSWSPCVAAEEFDSCASVCEAQMLGCAVTSCATEQPEWPIATLETFASLECGDLLQSLASSCEEPLPLTPEVVSLRCCCAG